MLFNYIRQVAAAFVGDRQSPYRANFYLIFILSDLHQSWLLLSLGYHNNVMGLVMFTLTRYAMRSAGTVAVLAVLILKFPELGTESIGDALEWVFYVTLPNFCFSKALQDLYDNHLKRKLQSSLRSLGSPLHSSGELSQLICHHE